MMASTTTTIVLTVAMMPMITFSRIQAATARIRSASRRLGIDPRGGARRRARGVECGARGGLDAPAHPPGRAAEGEVGHGREPGLVGAQGQQQVGDPVRRRQGRVVDAHAPAVRAVPPAREQQRPRRPEQPCPERAALEHEPGPGVQRPGVVADEVAEEPGGRALGARRRGCGVPPGALGTHDVGAALRVELRDHPGVREGHQRHREGDRRQDDEQHADREERDDVRDGAQRPQRAAPAQAPGVGPRAPVDGRELGQQPGGRAVGRGGHASGARPQPPEIGSRRMTRSASTGRSVTCSACPSPVLTMAK
jgi:hypothetical protein